jgi:hypothetical protein
MGYAIAQSSSDAANDLKFLLVLASDHITGATGKTPTVTILKTGASSFITPAGAVTEIGSGLYKVAGNQLDSNTLGPLLLHATAAACDPRDDTFAVVNYTPAAVHPLSPPTLATFGTTTALNLITGAFQDIGALAEGEPLSAAMGQDGLRRVNNMIALWALQPGTMLTNKREVFALTANKVSYSIGPTGDFDTVRPIYLTGAGLLLGGLSVPVEIPLGLLTEGAYQNLRMKTQPSTQPMAVYYNASQPFGDVRPWPVPTITLNSLVLYSDEAVSGFADLTTQYTFAPGYTEAIEYNLAKRLSTPYGRELPADVREFAAVALAWVKTANTKIVDMQIDAALIWGTRAPYNILSGQ